MDRIVGVETEYGCLLSDDEPHVNFELWPSKVKNYLFRKADAGTIDLHYRDYEEPPGNGGFLLNGGRLYLDMGHIEYDSPDFYRRGSRRSVESAGVRFRTAATGGPGEFPAEPARRSHRQRHLSVGAIQSRHHQRARRTAGRLPEISPAAFAHRRLEHEPVRHCAENRNDRLRSIVAGGRPFGAQPCPGRCGTEHARHFSRSR